MSAARSGVVDRLIEIRGTRADASELHRLRKQLEGKLGLSESAAGWTLASWCRALDIGMPGEIGAQQQGHVSLARDEQTATPIAGAEGKRSIAGRTGGFVMGSAATGRRHGRGSRWSFVG